MSRRIAPIGLGILALCLAGPANHSRGIELASRTTILVPQTVPAGTPRYFLARPAFGPRSPCCPGTRVYGSFGAGLPRFHWGYFGAGRYRHAVSHTSYYGDSFQWSFRW